MITIDDTRRERLGRQLKDALIARHTAATLERS